jgi:periplasmic protein TonB
MMKNQPVFSESQTLEDIVFEGRNRSYGAYDLNRKHRKYLIVAFFISLLGVSTAIAVPFLKAFNVSGINTLLAHDVVAKFSDVPDDAVPQPPPPPPPPPPILEIEKQLVYKTPVVVEEPVNGDQFMPVETMKGILINAPADIPSEQIKEEPVGIDDHTEEPVLFPEEKALFMGGDLNTFSKWVLENIKYPPIAEENGIFGRVIIEFCVNSSGEVVDIKFLRNLDPAIDEEAMRVISSSPLWTPARQGGRPVKQRFTIPVVFKI